MCSGVDKKGSGERDSNLEWKAEQREETGKEQVGKEWQTEGWGKERKRKGWRKGKGNKENWDGRKEEKVVDRGHGRNKETKEGRQWRRKRSGNEVELRGSCKRRNKEQNDKRL